MALPETVIPVVEIPAAKIRFSLVGPGRVGISLTHWLRATGARLVSVAARDVDSARALARQCGGAAVKIDGLDSSDSDLLLVTVSDAAIPAIAERLSRRPQAPVVLHAAGGFDAGILSPLGEAGCRTGTLHPLRAFAAPSRDADGAHGLVFTIDGDPEAVALAGRLTRAIGARPVEIDPSARALYHLAASLCAGGVVTLLGVADQLRETLGLPAEVAEGYVALAHQALDGASAADRSAVNASAVDGAAAQGPATALTGPVARGDADLVRHQLDELERTAPDLLDVVRAVGLETLRQRRAALGSSEGDDELSRILAPRPPDSS